MRVVAHVLLVLLGKSSQPVVLHQMGYVLYVQMQLQIHTTLATVDPPIRAHYLTAPSVQLGPISQ